MNGVSGRFLFDNGFSLSVVNEDFAQKANIDFDQSTNIIDANSKSSQVREATVDTVTILGHKFVETGFYQINTDAFLPCTDVDGVIGASIINKINWEIDFRNKKINLSQTPFQSDGVAIKMNYISNNSALINLQIKGKTIKHKVDFGRSGGINLSQEKLSSLFANERVEKRIGISSLSANGLGNIDSFYTTADKFEIAYNQTVLPSKDKIELSNRLKYPGYIGIDYFNEYLVVLNSTEKQMILSEFKPDTTDANGNKSYGIAIYPVEEKWKIIQLNPQIPSLKKSWLMSEVDLLDNQPIDRFRDICEYREYIDSKTEKEESLILLLKDIGDTIKLEYQEPPTIILE
ncbi:MAG: aspartyl protease family protein [Bacteroidia bacterium]